MMNEADGIVQATPVGMDTHPGVPFDLDLVRASAWVADVIYRPFETQLLCEAREHGHRVLDGRRMAIGQAVDSLRLITGLEPDSDRMGRDFSDLVTGRRPLSKLQGFK